MLAGVWGLHADHVAFYWLNIPVHSGHDVLMYESMDGCMDGWMTAFLIYLYASSYVNINLYVYV